jgi:hypothetical protein
LIVVSVAYWIIAWRRGAPEPALELGESTKVAASPNGGAPAAPLPSVSTES